MAGKFRRGRYASRKLKKKFQKKRYLRKNSRSVKRLAKAVYKLRKKERLNHTTLRFSQTFMADTIFPDYSQNVSRHSNIVSGPIFGTPDPADTPYPKKAYWKSLRLRCTLDVTGAAQGVPVVIPNILATTQITVALVSPKDASNQTSFDPTTGSISLSEGRDYVRNRMMQDSGIQSPGGHVKFDYSRWRVHKMRYFTMGNKGAYPISANNSQVQDPTHFDWTWKIYPRQLVQRTDIGSWATLNFNPDPSMNVYLVVLSSNLAENQTGSLMTQCMYKYITEGSL